MAEAKLTTTVIGPDTHIKGEMIFDSTARILGTFEGRIVAKGEVQIGEGAACKASVEGSNIIVDGVIEGDVTASDRVQLNNRARVVGDVTATTLVVAEGASFVGHCRVGGDGTAKGPPKTVDNTALSPDARRARAAGGSGSPVQSRPADLEATLAGLEARLAGLTRSRPAESAQSNGRDPHMD
jgi:cytoskeletal protein CcmA (bactofilin family)